MTGESLGRAARPRAATSTPGRWWRRASCALRVDKASGSGRYDRIVEMIEASEKLKSATEDKASHLADRLVPWSLGATVLTYLLTRNPTKALAILMVDFSCALKLSMPIAVLSAMRECGKSGIRVKGGKFLEAAAEAETIVFDKTGTLTHAMPRLALVVPFGGHDGGRDAASCRLPGGALSPLHGQRRGGRRPAAEPPPRGAALRSGVRGGPRHLQPGGRGKGASSAATTSSSRTRAAPCRTGEEERFDALPGPVFPPVSGHLPASSPPSSAWRTPCDRRPPPSWRSCGHLGVTKLVMMTGDSERTARSVAAAGGGGRVPLRGPAGG